MLPEACQPGDEPALSIIDAYCVPARIAISTSHAISYLILTTARDKNARIREVKDCVSGHTAHSVAEPQAKPSLPRVVCFHSGDAETLKLESASIFTVIISSLL